MAYYDCHAHLCDRAFDNDISEVVERAKKAGVRKILDTGLEEKTNRKVLENSRKYDIIKPALGISPTDSVRLSGNEFEKEISWIREQEFTAVGEVGLDYYWIKDQKEREKEEKCFLELIEVANELKKPLIVHSRNAEGKVIEILRSKANVPCVLHCFSGGEKELKNALEAGMYISIPTNVIYSQITQKIAIQAPPEKIITETDCPYLSPERGVRNEPKNVSRVVERVSELKGVEQKNLMKTIEDTICTLFGW
jgi:TatD DNase family protein